MLTGAERLVTTDLIVAELHALLTIGRAFTLDSSFSADGFEVVP